MDIKMITENDIDSLYCYYTDVVGVDKETFFDVLEIFGLTVAFNKYKAECELFCYKCC